MSMDPFGMQLDDKPSYIWRRVLLKVSGEALADHSQNIDRKITMAIAREVVSVMRLSIEKKFEQDKVFILQNKMVAIVSEGSYFSWIFLGIGNNGEYWHPNMCPDCFLYVGGCRAIYT
ncbi:hypothetical protein J1N35_039626 [Gossypium stocksii]|uniref:Uncharacterized protein n=1 Tax=Gossypium stocksii TaxID=47602 RepID=A0A9D3UCL5_9ROSI|nr:hypothetical protein J1N35_039626 [Gossypium stocksii]